MTVVREPDADLLETTALGEFVRGLEAKGYHFSSYEELWRWSVSDLSGFWGAVRDHFEPSRLSELAHWRVVRILWAASATVARLQGDMM